MKVHTEFVFFTYFYSLNRPPTTLRLSLDLSSTLVSWTWLIEYFAGARRLCKLAHALGCKSVAMDKKYDDGDNRTKNNSMDINTSAGFVQLSSKKILFGFESGISH